MSDKTKSKKTTRTATKKSLLKIEIWFPDESVFDVEFPSDLTVKELLGELTQHFDINHKQWSLCSKEGKVYSDDIKVGEIVINQNGSELRLKQIRMIPKPKWG